jgi:hypothetical protein
MHQRLRATVSDALFGTTALIWVGMLVGVSFVATPVKFTAPGLSLPVALEVGRVTFHLFSRIEWALAAFLFVISVSRMSLARTALAVSLILLVAVQAVWLLPALDARVSAIVAGGSVPPSQHHTLYAAIELGKFLLLAWAGFFGLRSLAQGRQ